MLKGQSEMPIDTTSVHRINIERDLGDLLPLVEISEEPRMIKVKPRAYIKERKKFEGISSIIRTFGGRYAYGDGEWRIPKQH